MDSQAISTMTQASAATSSAAGTQASTNRTQTGAASKSHVEAAAETKRAEADKAKVDVPVTARDPRSLQYQVDGTTHRVVATIVDDQSKTVVRQVPDAEVLRIAKSIDRMQGFLIEERA